MSSAGTNDEELELMRALLGDGIIEFISDGETVYLRWSLFTSLFGADTPWVSFADEGSDALGSLSGGLGVNQVATGPDSFLGYFGGIGSIDERGPAVIRGVATTHYAGTLDLAQAVALADPAQAEELRQQFGELGVTALGTMPIELWVDDDGFLRRFAMDFDFGPARRRGRGRPRARPPVHQRRLLQLRRRRPDHGALARRGHRTRRLQPLRLGLLAGRAPRAPRAGAPAPQTTTRGRRSSAGVSPAWCELCCSASREARAGW